MDKEPTITMPPECCHYMGKGGNGYPVYYDWKLVWSETDQCVICEKCGQKFYSLDPVPEQSADILRNKAWSIYRDQLRMGKVERMGDEMFKLVSCASVSAAKAFMDAANAQENATLPDVGNGKHESNGEAELWGYSPDMSFSAFHAEGYLQELNRQFLHPLGLAMAICFNERGFPIGLRIIDSRADLDGITFSENTIADANFQAKVKAVAEERLLREKGRIESLGFYIQPTDLPGNGTPT
jgi:hypothetical protein